MTEENLETIELNEKTDSIAIKTKCPQCGDEYFYGVPYVNVPCKKCGITYRTDFKQDIYTKKARYMEDKKTEKNGIVLKVTEQYKPALLHIMYNHVEQKCWDVSEITQTKEEFRYCYQCGYCMDCYTCECGNSFKKDKTKRKQKCPICNSTNFKRTYFKEAKKSGNMIACPKCSSDKVKLTRTNNKNKCHLCGSEHLSPAHIDNVYTVTIKRKKGYMK